MNEKNLPMNKIENTVKAYHSLIYGIAMRFTRKDHEDAMDLVQEICVKLYKNSHALPQDDEEIYRWVYTIAFRTGIDHYRSRYRRVKDMTLSAEDCSIPFYGMQNNLLNREHRELITKAMKALTEDQSQAITAYYLEGYKHQEIAGMLNTSTNAVGTIISRGLKKLRKEFDRKGLNDINMFL